MKRTIVACVLLTLLFLAVALLDWVFGLMRAAGFGWVGSLVLVSVLSGYAWWMAGDLLKGKRNG